MKKIFYVIMTLCFASAFSQTNRFFYEYKFIPDSTDRAEVKTEMMLLDINAKGSSYYSREKFVSDSILQADIEKQLRSTPKNISINKSGKSGEVPYKVTKEYPDFKTTLYTSILMDNYKISEDQKPEWKIFQDKQKIGEYNAQKATTSFGGREWVAWFTTDIPFQDGPYKFYGLPGLIVKIEDKTGSHSMVLKGNKKMEKENQLDIPNEIKLMGASGKDIEINEKQFKKVWRDYVNDPAKNMREMMMKNSGDSNSKIVFKSKTPDGREISDPNQVFREIDKRTKENLKKNNNPIEPDLYILNK